MKVIDKVSSPIRGIDQEPSAFCDSSTKFRFLFGDFPVFLLGEIHRCPGQERGPVGTGVYDATGIARLGSIRA